MSDADRWKLTLPHSREDSDDDLTTGEFGGPLEAEREFERRGNGPAEEETEDLVVFTNIIGSFVRGKCGLKLFDAERL